MIPHTRQSAAGTERKGGAGASCASCQPVHGGITLDTCVGMNMLKNPNFADMLAVHVGLDGRSVHLCAQAVTEMERKEIDVGKLRGVFEARGAAVSVGGGARDADRLAERLEAEHAGLHAGDSRILAHAVRTRTYLVTCDKELAAAACAAGVRVVNPDELCGTMRAARSRMGSLVDRTLREFGYAPRQRCR